MLPLNNYLASLRLRLKAPPVATKDVRMAIGRATGVDLKENEFEITRGTVRILTRPEKRILILTHRDEIISILNEAGVRVDKIV